MDDAKLANLMYDEPGLAQAKTEGIDFVCIFENLWCRIEQIPMFAFPGVKRKGIYFARPTNRSLRWAVS
jgi:hypothetical protein